MELAKVTSKGQVTIPADIRRKLRLKTGDKVLFIEKDDGVIMLNSSSIALENIQRAMAGEAERAGLKSEEDVTELVRTVRKRNRK